MSWLYLVERANKANSVEKADKANFSVGINACVRHPYPSPSSGRSSDHLVSISAFTFSNPGLNTILRSY